MGPFSAVWNMDLVLLSHRSGRVRDQGLPRWAREERDVPISSGSRRVVCESSGLDGPGGVTKPRALSTPRQISPSQACVVVLRREEVAVPAMPPLSPPSDQRWLHGWGGLGGFSVLGSELEIRISSNWRLPLAMLIYAGVFPWQQSGDTGCPGTGTGFIYYRGCIP